MNLKKYISCVLAVLLSVGAFAYPVVEEDEQAAQLLQQYQQQIQQLQQDLAQKLLPPCKAVAAFLLKEVQAEAEQLTEEQIEAIVEERFSQLTEEQMAAISEEDLTDEQMESVVQAQVLAYLVEKKKSLPFVKEKLTEIDNNLAELLAPTFKDFDLAQFNEQYNQMLQAYGLPKQQFTLQEAQEMLKATYLSTALLSFMQNKSLNEDESALLTLLLFTRQEAN